jgi:hypothetical protein
MLAVIDVVGVLAGCGLLHTATLEETGAGWADEVEQRHPGEEDSRDDDGEDNAGGLFGHFDSPWPLVEAMQERLSLGGASPAIR